LGDGGGVQARPVGGRKPVDQDARREVSRDMTWERFFDLVLLVAALYTLYQLKAKYWTGGTAQA
jgi:hypothetical protein